MQTAELHAEAARVRALHPRPIAIKQDCLATTKGINARDLMGMTFPEIQYVVPGYIAEGLTVFAGSPKIGKSWLMLGVALAVAAGMPAFGSVPCKAGDVLYLALEDNPRRLQKRLRQMHPGVVPDRLTFMTEWPDLDGDCLAEIQTWLAHTPEARLVIIDVYAKVKGTGGGNRPQYELDYEAATGLQKLAGRFGIAIVLVHHTRKMAADDPFDAVSGTRGLPGAADTVIVLQRDPTAQHPTLYGRGRDIEEFEVAMTFDQEMGTWSVIGDASRIAKTEERQEIIEVLGRSVDPMTPTEIADRLGKSRTNISHRLAKLLDEGKVERHSKGRWALIPPCHSDHSSHSFTPESDQSDWSDRVLDDDEAWLGLPGRAQ